MMNPAAKSINFDIPPAVLQAAQLAKAGSSASPRTGGLRTASSTLSGSRSGPRPAIALGPLLKLIALTYHVKTAADDAQEMRRRELGEPTGETTLAGSSVTAVSLPVTPLAPKGVPLPTTADAALHVLPSLALASARPLAMLGVRDWRSPPPTKATR